MRLLPYAIVGAAVPVGMWIVYTMTRMAIRHIAGILRGDR